MYRNILPSKLKTPGVVQIHEEDGMRLLFCALSVGLMSGSAAVAQQKTTIKPVTVAFRNAQGQNVGTAVLSDAPNGVNIKLDITNLPPG